MPDDTKVVIQVHRLSKEAYEVLERQCGPIKPTTTTTPIEAGYTLGVQHVLKMVREGFAHG